MSRRERLLFALLAVSYGYFYPGAGQNEAARFDLTRALVEDGRTSVDRFRYNSADLVEVGGRTFSSKAPGASLLAVAPFALWSSVLRPLRQPAWQYWDRVAWLTGATTLGLASALAGVCTLRALSPLVGADAALLGTLAVWLGSIVFPFSAAFFGHALAAALLALSFGVVLPLRARPDRVPRPRARLALAGLLVGLAVTTEYPAVLVAAALVFYTLAAVRTRERPLRLAGWYAVGGLVGIAPLLAYQWAAFGGVFFVPYQAYAEAAGAVPFAGHRLGLLGIHWPGSAAFLDVLASITLRPARGLLYLGADASGVYACCPVLWLALPGLLLMLRDPGLRAEAALALAAALAMLCLNASYGDSILYWGGGTSVGARHLIPALPLLALPIALAARRLPLLFWPLFLVSCFFMLLATGIELRLPYEHANPYRDFLLPLYREGLFGMTRSVLFDGGPGSERAGATSLARLFGVPGPWQLLPLMLVWGGIGLALSRSRAAGAALFALAVGVAAAPVLSAAGSGADIGPIVGRYFLNPSWAGIPPLLRRHASLDFDWSRRGPLPLPWSAEWRGFLDVAEPGEHRFRVAARGAAQLWIDEQAVVESTGLRTGPPGRIRLSAGVHEILLRHVPSAPAPLRVYWTRPGAAEGVIPPAAFCAPPVATARVPGSGPGL